MFELTPLALLSNILLSICSIIGLSAIFIKKYFHKSIFIRWLFLFSFFMIVISILSAHYIYHQDFISGLIANSGFFYVFSPFAFYRLICYEFSPLNKQYSIEFTKIFKIIIVCVWLQAIYLALFSIFGWSYIFVSPFSGNSIQIDGGRVAKGIVYFGAFYYFIKYFIDKKTINVFYAIMLLFITQLYDIQRWDLVCCLLTFILIFYKFRKSTNAKLILVGLPIVVLCGFFFLSSNEKITNEFSTKYEQAIKLFQPGASQNNIEDPSVYIRIYETEYAMSGFQQNPIFGNGILRPSFQKQILPDLYFYTSDIGIFGIMYSFGIFGVVVVLLIAFLGVRLYSKNMFSDIIIASLCTYIMFIIMFSFKDGNIIFNPLRVALLGFIVWHNSRRNIYKKNKN